MRRGAAWLVGASLGAAVAVGAIAVRLAPPHLAVPPQGAVLAGVTIVNPGSPRAADRTIVVRDGRIASIKKSTAAERAASGDAGRFVLPGLIDMHVHHPPDTPLGDVELFGLLFLAHGVTTVRDTGSFDGSILETRRRIAAGEHPGPRVFACGPIVDGDPPYWPGSRVATDREGGRAVVRDLADDGVDCIKVYDNLSAEAFAGVAEEAASRRLPVIGHVPREVPLGTAGLADVQHLTGVARGDEPLDEARIRAVVTSAVVRDVAHTPTLVVFDRLSRLADYAESPDGPAAAMLPRYYREVLWDPRWDRRFESFTADRWDAMRETIANAKKLVRRLHEAGARIHVGTDTMNPFVVPGASLHEEMAELVDAGIPLEEVWRAATAVSGRSLGKPGLGRIVPGAPADLLVFAEDPTRDLAALATLEAVVADGRLYRRAELDAARERWREHMADPLFDGVTRRLAAWLAPG